MRVSILIFSCLLSFSVSDKLSETEDEERSKECGRAIDSKSPSNDELSPWSVRLQLKPFFVSASLISKRHVMTSGLALMETEDNGATWKWKMDEAEVDLKTCKDGVMEAPTDSITVDLKACSNHFLCPWMPGIPVKSMRYIGSCESDKLSSGLILIEMGRDIPDDSSYFTPVCLPDSSDVVDDGEDLQAHQASHLNFKPVIKIVSAKVNTSIHSKRCSTSISNTVCADMEMCLNAYGASLLKKSNDRNTVVAFSGYYQDKCTIQKFSYVASHKEKICELSGICKKTSTLFTPKSKSPPTPITLSSEFIKLSSEENEENAKTCGIPSNPDSKLESELSPWTVTLKVENAPTGNTTSQIWTSSTLISKRHVVVAAFALMNGKEGDWNTVRWVPDDTKVDMSKCKNNVMEIPVEYMRKTKVFMSPCTDKFQCTSGFNRFVKSAVYFGVCEPDQMAFGVILLELTEDVPPPGVPNVIPSCLAEKRMPQLESNLKLHALRVDNKTGYVRSIRPAQTVQCDNTIEYYNKICFTRPTCSKYSAGGLLRKENGKQKLIGIMYYHSPDCKENDAISIEVLADFFCVYAGICNETPVSSKSNNNQPDPTGKLNPIVTTPLVTTTTTIRTDAPHIQNTQTGNNRKQETTIHSKTERTTTVENAKSTLRDSTVQSSTSENIIVKRTTTENGSVINEDEDDYDGEDDRKEDVEKDGANEDDEPDNGTQEQPKKEKLVQQPEDYEGQGSESNGRGSQDGTAVLESSSPLFTYSGVLILLTIFYV
ncbi:Protein CBG25351 [Caenorhabditis briggsae]|uniref:Protein CBG25351 n=1 Tax=Caenorhabditis briggsae TaxID=6238 RepID=B6IIL5_CAEBR|nr:Protein CBG25351 [Caenorhabditis briggsae]CAR99745.1 Protein CBG25351 [Caenorhabditis briggsae]